MEVDKNVKHVVTKEVINFNKKVIVLMGEQHTAQPDEEFCTIISKQLKIIDTIVIYVFIQKLAKKRKKLL